MMFGDAPILPTSTESYAFQVAGHSRENASSFEILRDKSKPIIYKSLQDRERGMREVMFYQRVFSPDASEALKRVRQFIPTYYGVYQCPGTKAYYMALSDLVAEFKHPNICDFKMGTVINYPDEVIPPDQFQYIWRRELGIMLAGIQVSTPILKRESSTLPDISSISPKRAHFSYDEQLSLPFEIINLTTPELSIHQSNNNLQETTYEHSQSTCTKEDELEQIFTDYESVEDQLLFSDIHLESIKVDFSMDNLRNQWKQVLLRIPSSNHDDDDSVDNHPTGEKFTLGKFKAIENQEIEHELTTYFKKETFNNLKVIGQFNMGFIIAQHNQDLFIIDQHASDEKYRFEQLLENYRFKSQPLVVPQKLNLTIANEQVLISNLDVFAKNGFAFRIHNDEPAGQQVFLVAAPMLENKLFSYRDIEEMLFVLSETSILTNMGSMDHPWNCPHGRPTMRHLFHLGLLND
ncbi:unnamed protein product [Schistosoma turkestanicum]|nr:unnamed protein product [Schistosoma turkestanicum]